METNKEIPPIIYGAIEVMKKCFGGTDVKLISTEMYRLEPTPDAKAGKIGVDIEIEGIKTFLSYNDFAVDIACSPYGEMIANEFVYTIIKEGHQVNLYNEYLDWLKKTHNLTPNDTYSGVNAILELKSMRDEHFGLLGETQLVRLMKEEGTFEKRKEEWEKYSILTFEEYINSKQKNHISDNLMEN